MATFFNVSGSKLVQEKGIRRRYWEKSTDSVYVVQDNESFVARVRAVEFTTNWNGSTYVRWESDKGTQYWSNINDYANIIKNLDIEKGGWVQGTFRFATRGGAYKSMVLAANRIVPEPVSPLE